MFWRKKTTDKSQRPSVDDLGEFVEWLLKNGKDFEIYRTTAQATLGRFVRVQLENVLQDLDANGDGDSLTAHIDAGCKDYNDNYHELVATAGGFQNLPSHIHAKAFPLLVKLRAEMYVLNHKYDLPLTEPMLATCGPLQEI